MEWCSCNHCCSGKAIILHLVILCVCSLRYPACNVHTPYCYMWTAPFYSIFPHYLTNGTIFGEKFTEHKMRVLIFLHFVLIFSTFCFDFLYICFDFLYILFWFSLRFVLIFSTFCFDFLYILFWFSLHFV